jgi:sugar/nucleoside kinase (ribokinase family)
MKLGRTLRLWASATADFAALGENSLDTLVIASGPGHAGKQRASALVELPGGQAVARLGWRSRYIGVVGDDAAGEVVTRALKTAHVDPVLSIRAGVQTRRAVIVVDDVSGDRRVYERRDPALALSGADAPDTVFADTRILLIDLCDPPAALRAAQVARAADVRTLVDVDRPDSSLAALFRLVDLIVVPEGALAAIAGTGEAGRALARLSEESGAAAVIATLGSEGAIAVCQGREVRSAAHPVSVVDTTGAGDAFRAGLAAGWLARGAEDPDLAELLADANLVASLNCRALGAQTALPQALEVPRHLRGRV